MKNKNSEELKAYLDKAVKQFNQPAFIVDDPISIPHKFNLLQDKEIIGFWVAMLSWGQRKTIINKANELIDYMDGTPYDFIQNHSEKDLKPLLNFKHRTFQATDTLYFIDFFKRYYAKHDSLEDAFASNLSSSDPTIEPALIGFQKAFFDHENAPRRTQKHVASPARKSTCKRLNMFLRWMVRKDKKGVDFGLWKKIKPAQLQIPFDVHVERVARELKLIKRKQRDWKTVLELTEALKQFDPKDPVKYDFALFGIGVLQKTKAAMDIPKRLR